MKLNLLGTSVLFVICLIMTMKKRRYFIVRGVVFVELVDERITSTVLHVNVAYPFFNKIIIHVSKVSSSRVALSAWMICTLRDMELRFSAVATQCIPHAYQVTCKQTSMPVQCAKSQLLILKSLRRKWICKSLWRRCHKSTKTRSWPSSAMIAWPRVTYHSILLVVSARAAHPITPPELEKLDQQRHQQQLLRTQLLLLQKVRLLNHHH